MKINDELLFFMMKSRLFASLSFSLPPTVEGGASPFLSLSEQAGCALAHPSSPVPLETSTLPLLPPPASSWAG